MFLGSYKFTHLIVFIVHVIVCIPCLACTLAHTLARMPMLARMPTLARTLTRMRYKGYLIGSSGKCTEDVFVRGVTVKLSY